VGGVMKFEPEITIESLVILEQQVADFRCRYHQLAMVAGSDQLDLALIATRKLAVAQRNLMGTLTKLKSAIPAQDQRIAAPVSVTELATRAALHVFEDCMRRLYVELSAPAGQGALRTMFCGRLRNIDDVCDFVRGRVQQIRATSWATGVAQRLILEMSANVDFLHFLHEGGNQAGRSSTRLACAQMLTVLTLTLDVRAPAMDSSACAVSALATRDDAPP